MHTDSNHTSLWWLDCHSPVAAQWLEQAPTRLPAHELDAAQARYRAEERQRFILSRLLLRRALTTQHPQFTEPSWLFSPGRHGKPQLAAGFPPTAFNLSHSGNLVVVALARHGEVGIDIELPGTRIQHRRVAARFFRESECAALPDDDDALWIRQFYRLWMLKEACIKSLGLRVADGLKHTAFAFDDQHIALEHDFDTSLQPFLLEVAGNELALCLADAPADRAMPISVHSWDERGEPCNLPCSVLLTPRPPERR